MSSTRDVASLIRAHAPLVWRALRYQGVPEGELEDLSQEVFLVMVRSLHQFEGRSDVKTWIYGVCRNVARHAKRSHARSRERATDALPDPAIAETQTRDLARARVVEGVREALNGLPEPARAVFVLYELEHVAMEQIAQSLGCTPSTAYSRLYAARAHVRSRLEARGLIEPDQDIAEVV
jgi:RNA polymerase sigma-70 factor (ECF subfamily)